MDSIPLEQQFEDKSLITVLAEVVGFDSNRHVHQMKTALYGHQFEFHGELPKDSTVVVLVDVRVYRSEAKFLVKSESASKCFPRTHISMNHLADVVELCAGMGCLGFGLQAAGLRHPMLQSLPQQAAQPQHSHPPLQAGLEPDTP